MAEEFPAEQNGQQTAAHPREEEIAAADKAAVENGPEPTEPRGLDAAQMWVAIFLIAMAGLIAYSNALTIPFHYEDQVVLRDNAALHRLPTFFQGLDAAGASGPLAMLSLAVNWWVAPGHAIVFHLVNVAIHVLNGVLLFLVCRRLLGKGTRDAVAMLAGLLFVLHPAATESVNYVVGRSILLAMAFMLLAILLFLRASEGEKTALWPLGLSYAAFVLAWASRPAAVVFPLLILIVDLALHGGRSALGRLGVHAVYWALALALTMARGVAHAPQGAADIWAEDPLRPEAAGVAEALLRYVMLTVSPGGLSVEHALSGELPGAVAVMAAVGLVLVVAAAALLWKRSILGVAIAWYVVGLVPAWMAVAARGDMSERHLYIPLAGAMLVLPWLLSRGLREPRVRVVAGVAAAAVALLAGASCFMRNQVWGTEAGLWADAAQKAPESPLPQQRLGAVYRGIGEVAMRNARQRAEHDVAAAGVAEQREVAEEAFGRAEEHLRRAVDLGGGDAATWHGLGIVQEHLGKPDEALDAMLEALRLEPGNGTYTAHVAGLLHARWMMSGDAEDLNRALEYYARADQLGGLTENLSAQYCAALLAMGNAARAEQVLLKAGAAHEWSQLAAQLGETRRILQAQRELEGRAASVLSRDPNNVEALVLSARARLGRGQSLEAAYVLERALSLQPGHAQAWGLLGLVKARMDEAGGFVAEWGGGAPSSSEPGKNPWLDLARMCATSGLWDAASAYLECEPARAAGTGAPLLTLADVAMELNRADLAGRYLDEAADADPADPRPWLHKCDMALDSENQALAARALGEAERRGAPAEEIARRKEKIDAAHLEQPQEAFAPVVR
ncbi:MAG: tetratricopeptide repeat protein [Candidatus Hydrogenedentes bacterium]|nr:tetratricopeptide repeat protein [Candidatus Hydrogenedentota bacterium]